MPGRAVSERAEQAQTLYRKGYKLIEISRELGVPEGTVRRWKYTYGWEHGGKIERSGKTSVRKRGAQPGNKNSRGAPKGNKRAEKLGFYSKYLPEETLELFDAMEEFDPLDLMWQSIKLQYAAIVRAQKIAFVQDQKDKTTEITAVSEGPDSQSVSYDVQQAWDKHENFMKAQSAAMSTLKSLIKQYEDMLTARGAAATEEQRLRLDLLRAKLDGGAGGDAQKVVIINDVG